MDWKRFWNENPQIRDADVRRQVGRTFRQVPYSDEAIDQLSARLLELLEPRSSATLLDLCCGNGLVTSRLAASFESVTAIDYSQTLIAVANARFFRPNVRYLVDDARRVEAVPHDRILISGAFQFFSNAEALLVLQHLRRLVRDDGRVVLGDVPDGDRIWQFYRGVRGRLQYAFESIFDRPTIGSWWSPAALERLAHETGWNLTVHYQAPDLPNHYFRYDAVLEPRLDRPEIRRSDTNRQI
jgi:cyclopropane fatty-acyl-phospholipid synthase-like methyltransferase